jgi:hypothetical protein
MKRLIAFVFLAALASCDAGAFKLQALGPAPQQPGSSRLALGFLSLFGSDVHERITRQAYEKAGVKLTDDVMAGVRWNDAPPVMRMGPLAGACNMACWISMLRVDSLALEVLARREQAIPVLRSHFGDMQFLHAMAARAGERPADTRDKALRWLEFSYRVARGEIGPRVNVFSLRESGVEMDSGTRDWVSSLFGSPEKQLWRVQDVFVPGVGDLRKVAFGTFLHLVEDSYSASHVRRLSRRVQPNGCPSYDAADPIAEFRTYVGQDTEKHALCDDPPDWLDAPREGSPIDLLAELVEAYSQGRDWSTVKAMLEERGFRLAEGAAAARPGACFEAPPMVNTTDETRERPKALAAECATR